MPSLRRNKAKGIEESVTVAEGLAKLYTARLLDLERESRYNHFYSPLCTPGDFSSKPMIMLIGQYSTGKTTFISHLLETDYPGTAIGPEPTTDRFVAVMHGERDQRIPGNAAVADPSRPFERLSDFGNSFLTRFEVAVSPSPLLNGFTIIDTPGVLSGNKQTSRGYDFEGVIKWYAERVDLILLMFDAHKLDISDEFKRCIMSIRGNDTKVRIVLNKADMVTQQQLMRVYGALMWSLGKVIPTPEVNRVYIGSFWDKPLDPKGLPNRDLFESETADLYSSIQSLPRNSAVRKLNDFIKRARLLRCHLRICDYLRDEMPALIGKEKKQKKLLSELPMIFSKLSSLHNIPLGDFPDPEFFKTKCNEAFMDLSKFPKLDSSRMRQLEEVITKHVPALMALIPQEEQRIDQQQEAMTAADYASPFLHLKNSNVGPNPALVRLLSNPPDISTTAAEWASFSLDANGFLSGANAKHVLVESRLPSTVLHRVWALADAPSKDGLLSHYEYALCKLFIEIKSQHGFELPVELPAELYPPESPAPPGTLTALELATQLASVQGRK